MMERSGKGPRSALGEVLMVTYYAHSGVLPDRSDWQPLKAHLRATADLARCRAESALPNAPDFAATAWWTGLLHDLGKDSDEFQSMLQVRIPQAALYIGRTRRREMVPVI